MKTFNLSTLAFVILAVVIAASQTEWEPLDCAGIDIAVYKSNFLTKAQCKDQCDIDPECSFVVYGGQKGDIGSDNDWWVNRCVMRKHLNLPCPRSTWMQTYIKKEKSTSDAECTDVKCTFESGEWGEWGQCSETCSIGWRERIFWGKLPSGYVTQTKERQKCALLDINCEAIVEDCVGDYLRCCKNEDKDENCKKGSKTEHCKKPLCTNLDGTCKEDEFKCRNGPCIPNDWRCDKEEDCWDRSDEDSCV